MLSVFIIFIFCIVTIFSPLSQALALGPFGGMILFLFPACIPYGGNAGGSHIILGPPTAGKYMWSPGISFSYLWGPPSHIGQWLLGMSGPMTACVFMTPVGPQMYDWGWLILFHGSSQ
jgi:hypothetical protein